MLNADNVSVFMIHDKVKEMYMEALGNEYVYIGKAKVENFWIDIHGEPNHEVALPDIKKFEELKYPIRTNNLLIISIKID